MQTEEMKHWLKRGFYAQKRSAVLEELISRCREQAQGLSRSRSGSAPTSGTDNRTEQALLKLADLERRYADEQCRLAEVSVEIAGAIALLEDDDLAAVLESRYLLMRTAEQTAEALHYHPNTVKGKEKAAIAKLCTKMS